MNISSACRSWSLGDRSERINRYLTVGSGILSLAFGLFLAYQIGIVDGLLHRQLPLGAGKGGRVAA